MPRRVGLRNGVLTASVALAALLSTGAGSSAAEVAASACPPPADPSAALAPAPAAPAGGTEPAAEQVLVCVGSQAITGAPYSQWLTVATKSNGTSKGQPALSPAELQGEVLKFLISADWVKGEAGDRGIAVSAAEVKKQFDRIRALQFRKRGEFQAFLNSSGQTVADLLFRVELNLLSARIQKRVVAGRHSASSQHRALSQFVKAFKAKWEAQTYCASEYDVEDCGHVQDSV